MSDGDPISSKPDPAEPDKEEQKPNVLGIPLAGWALVSVSVIFVIYVACHYGLKLYGDWEKLHSDNVSLQGELASARQEGTKLASINGSTTAISNLIAAEEKYHKHDHSGHQIALHVEGKGTVYATYFDSDGCIAIARPGEGSPYQPQPAAAIEWSLGPDKRPSPLAPAEALPMPVTQSSASGIQFVRPGNRDSERGAPVLLRTQNFVGKERSEDVLPVQAGCWNGVHPWPFSSWNGPANGCWVPVYRKWNDGCTHYQMLNTCTGQWDPRIFWTFCNPQHHP